MDPDLRKQIRPHWPDALPATTDQKVGSSSSSERALGGPAFDLPELARVISEVTGTPVTYRDLPVEEYASLLQGAGLDEATARFVAALDASIAHGDLETSSQGWGFESLRARHVSASQGPFSRA